MGRSMRKRKVHKSVTSSTAGVVQSKTSHQGSTVRSTSILSHESSTRIPHRICYQQMGTKAFDLLKNRLLFQTEEKFESGYEPILVASVALELSLALLRRGAEGATEDFLSMALDMRQIRDIVLDNYNAVMIGKESIPGSAVSSYINFLVVDESFPLENEFARTAVNGFLTKCLILPMLRSPKVCVEIMNSEIERLTDGLIPEALLPDDFSTGAPIAVVSALYFKGMWRFPFHRHSTKKEKFHSMTLGTRSVDMMSGQGHFGYLALPRKAGRLLLLPYARDDLALLLALPNDIEGLDKLEDNLSSVRLTDVIRAMSHPYISVSIPKFVLEKHHDFMNDLSSLGISCIAQPVFAQFPFISRREGIYVGSMVQKVVFELSEEGNWNDGYPIVPEAVCAIKGKAFVADHPFAFFVLNVSTGSILIAGRYE